MSLFKPKLVGMCFACKKEMTLFGINGHYRICKVAVVFVPGMAYNQENIRECKKISQRKRMENPEVKAHVKESAMLTRFKNTLEWECPKNNEVGESSWYDGIYHSPGDGLFKYTNDGLFHFPDDELFRYPEDGLFHS
jgi:hypothetical protein